MITTLILLGLLLFALVVLVVITSSFIGFLQTRVPFVPTSDEDVATIVKKVGISEKDTFIDLGSGDGRVVFLVNSLTNARTIGYELTWWTYVLSVLKLKVKRAKLKVEFRNQDFFKHSWEEASVIYGYLYPPLMGRVEEKFLQDCKPGTVAVIRDFPFPNLQPAEVFVTTPAGAILAPNEYSAQESVSNKPVTKLKKLQYLLQSFLRAGKPGRHEIFIYRKA